MPSIKQSQGVDRSKLEPAAPSENIGMAPPPPESRFGVSRFFRCALPSAISGLDGNIRQFYGTAGVLPQQRTMPITAQAFPTKGTSGAAGAPGASGKSGRDGADLHRVDIPLTVTFGAIPQATGLVGLGRTLSLLAVSFPSASRIRLYSTTAARDADVARNAGPLASVPEGLIADVSLGATFSGGFPFVWVMQPLAPGADMRQFSDGQLAYTVDSYGALVVPSFSTNSTNSNVNVLAAIGNPVVIRAQFASYAGLHSTVIYDVIVWFTSATSSGDYSTDLAGGIVLPFYDNGALKQNVHAATTAVQGVFGAKTDWLSVPVGAVDWNWQVLTTPHNFTNSNFDFSNIASYAALTLTCTVLREEL